MLVVKPGKLVTYLPILLNAAVNIILKEKSNTAKMVIDSWSTFLVRPLRKLTCYFGPLLG